MKEWTYVPCPSPAGGPAASVVELRRVLESRDPGGTSLGIYHRRRIAGSRSWSVHACGRAIDWQPSSRQLGDALAAELVAVAGDHGIQLILWRNLQWGGRGGPSWRRAAGAYHTHLHIELRS